jgi:FkbM family methyltransferase
MGRLQHDFGLVPDYELVLEGSYRKLIEPGDTVVDIGAHSGRHTDVFARIVGETGSVHAFEPLPEAMDYLKSRSLGRHVHLHALAVAPERGEASFVYARGAPEESGLRPKAYNRPDLVSPVTITVEVRPLDDMASRLGMVHFIKIDAEGAEIGCLKSAEAIIRRCRPWITVEYGYPGYSAYGLEKRSLFDQAAAMGYVIGDLFGAVCDTVENWETICDAAYWDWYLLPGERLPQWLSRMAAPLPNPLRPVAEVAAPAIPADDALRQEIAELQAEVASLHGSRSWKITAPFRAVGRRIRLGARS